MKYNILIILSLLFFSKMEAQNNTNNTENGFHLEVEIPTQKEKKIYLGQYWKENTYAVDSISLSDEGKGIFSQPSKYPSGQYFLHIKPNFYIDLLLDKEQGNIYFYINEKDFQKSRITGCEDTKTLLEYLNIVQEADRLKDKIEDAKTTEQQLSKLKKKVDELEQKKKTFVSTSLTLNKDSWSSLFLKGLEPITLPYPEPKSAQEMKENNSYAKEHYFDNISLTDPRFWRTNFFSSYLENYMRQWVVQTPDSIAAAASQLIGRTQNNDQCFKEMLSKFTNESIASKVMGDENIWAKLFEDYILDKNIDWIDQTQYSELRSMYEIMKNNRIGMKAQNLALESINGDKINTNDIAADYTILYFYDPDCGHCKTETPKLHNGLYKEYKDKGVEVIAINIGSNKQLWETFVKENNLSDWINCADMEYKSQYWMSFDTTGIPSSYILNKDKIIIARKIDEQNMLKLLDYYTKDKNGTN